MEEAEIINQAYLALKKVPEKDLLIIELANRFVKDGALDLDAIAENEAEINMAMTEAKMYGAHTMVAVDALKRLEPLKPHVRY